MLSMIDLRRGGLAAMMLAVSVLPVDAQEAAIYSGTDRMHPVWAASSMVSAQEEVAA